MLLNKAHYQTLNELREMELTDLVQLRNEVLSYYKELKEAYYHFNIAHIDGEEDLDLFINRIDHVLWGAPLENDNQ